jgi:tetratricopeptide (TPR) repeat protein
VISALLSLGVAASLCAQQPAAPPAGNQKPAPAQSNGNPFPEDTTTVPVMPNASTSAQPDAAAPGVARVPLPTGDNDPARSPDDAGASTSIPSSASGESSSSVADIDSMMPKDDEERKGRRRQNEAPEYHETAAADIDVAKYYLERKDWKAALSRFQSAMILDPENPDIFWGMAEAARHMGDFASARSYYQKVYDYDPDSRHGKDARKALKDPEIANAQSTAKSPAPSPQK